MGFRLQGTRLMKRITELLAEVSNHPAFVNYRETMKWVSEHYPNGLPGMNLDLYIRKADTDFKLP